MAFRIGGYNWQGRKWRLVRSLVVLAAQITELRPATQPNDGTVASKAHDLNDIKDGEYNSDHHPDEDGDVLALDAGEPADEPEWCQDLYEALRESRDPRIRYVIHGGRMFSSYPAHGYKAWEDRPYTGKNSHPTHIHVSVYDNPALAEDPSPWHIEEEQMQPDTETYRKVTNVPTEQWARDVVDRAIADKRLIIDDDHPDDWNEPMTTGRYLTFRDREEQQA
jgi:hypothetical protein